MFQQIPHKLAEVISSLIDRVPSNRAPTYEILESQIFPSYFDELYAFLMAYHALCKKIIPTTDVLDVNDQLKL
jgi:hypothetical protein